jgi:tRNA(fMet)-specific endonuclease VapC
LPNFQKIFSRKADATMQPTKNAQDYLTMTTDYLLDTNVCIAIRELIKGRSTSNPEKARQLTQVKARWSQVPKEQLLMSAVTLGELRYGAEKSTNPESAKKLIDDVRSNVRVLHLDDATGEHYGEIRATLERQGQTIGPNDMWIAAHGRAHRCTVVTNNTREFSRVPGLTCEDWTV